MKPRDAERSKNFFALGLISLDVHAAGRADDRVDRAALRVAPAGARRQPRRVQGRPPLRRDRRAVRPPVRDPARAASSPGKYRNITGNLATAYGLIAGAQQAKLPIMYASYPITPASDILHELSKHKNFGVRTLQAEDEIAAAAVAIGAAFAGHLGVTATSGPGVDLKSEALGLAISLELPLVLVDVQRGGPSTGLPTKTEQSDLLLAMYGRHGESPLPIVAAQSPSHCFDAAFEAVRIALEVPHAGDPAHRRLPRQRLGAVDAPRRRRAARHLGAVRRGAEPRRRVLAVPARPRDARPAVGDPGHAGADAPHRRHREAGRHRQHQLRAREPRADDPHPGRQGRRHRQRHPASSRSTATASADVLVLGWGSTWGPISEAVRRVRAGGRQVDHAHLMHLNPFPANLGDVLRSYREGARARR